MIRIKFDNIGKCAQLGMYMTLDVYSEVPIVSKHTFHYCSDERSWCYLLSDAG